MANTSQYQAANIAPLIKSPSLWLPKPVEFPMDVHPLPDDISAYFVYPFTLEPHILAQQPPIHEKIRALRERYARMLDDRRREEEEKRKEAMNRIAPGYNPSTSLLVPNTRTTNGTHDMISPTAAVGSSATSSAPKPQEKEEAPEDAFLSLRI
ncbi:hypothetical protein QFC20_006826 [Naganishia adeliensis]|uniref:Uncharacterized protein n=1 Tax=Naganishia adeliensis TaxID=92952 RepID=A0ACC2V7A3_9TREE|nr:hypothetical protein QFC20_006826 [Naganishia adeliensis]